MFDLWNMVNLRCVEFNCWEVALQHDPQHGDNPDLFVFGSAEAAKIGGARRRRQRANPSRHSDAQGTLLWRTELRPRSRLKIGRYRRDNRDPFPLILPLASRSRRRDRTSTKEATRRSAMFKRRRSGDVLGAPSSRRARATKQDDRVAGDSAFRARHRLISWERVGAFPVD